MKILLVYPQYPDTFWSFKHALKFISKRAQFPPLGLLTIASMLPKEWDKKLINLNIRKLEEKDIEWADMVFISAMLIQSGSAREVIDQCKAKGKKIVAGGPAFTAEHEKFSSVDHFVLDEGEITLPMFLKDLEQGNPQPIYRSSEKPDLSKTPIPMWSLINFKDYSSMAVQFSRGCPFNCEFCDIIVLNGRVPRTKSTEQMIGEIQALYDAGWRGSIFIVDDNFIGNKTNVKALLKELIVWQKEHRYAFNFLTEASTNLADDAELMRLMSAANFNKVFLGIETTNIDSLKECSKFQNTKRNLAEAVKKIHQNGMQVMGGFIVGFDSDTEKIFESQIKFIQDVGVVTAMVGVLTALPQTRLWHRLKAEGRISNDSPGDNTAGFLNFIPKMGKDKLMKGYKKILATIYSPKKYYQRVHTFIKNYNPTSKVRLTLESISAFLKSIWRIGIASRARFYYWGLLIRTFFTKVKAIPIAVEMAIVGLHFEKITKKILETA